MEATFWLVPLAFCLDLLIGDPVYAWHPVRLLGNQLIQPLEDRLRSLGATGYWGGGFLTVLTVLIAGNTVWFIQQVLVSWPLLHLLFSLFVIYSCLAIKDLQVHLFRVRAALLAGNLPEARRRLALIVGRETDQLTEEEIARACVETVAENISDGVIAPLFYAFLGGAPLMVIYKAVNTLDSMVGYRSEKYLQFGACSARLDDLLNWLPARLSLVLVMVAGFSSNRNWLVSWKIALRDRLAHLSPNAAHPEAALAASLGLRLGGSSYYAGKLVEKPFLHKEGRLVTIADISKSWQVCFRAALLGLFLFLLLAWELKRTGS